MRWPTWLLGAACSNTQLATSWYIEHVTQGVSSPASIDYIIIGHQSYVRLQCEPTGCDTVIFAIHTSNVQPFIVLDGIRCANSACPETVWTESIDLSPNIDLESRSGASTLETQVCYNCAPEATVSYLATKG